MEDGQARLSSTPGAAHEELALRLERFRWAAPDRLEVAGELLGSIEREFDEPTLVVHGGDRAHRLPAASGSASRRPQDDGDWHAAFLWEEAPFVFSAAELHLAAELVIELPELSADRGYAPRPLLRPRRSTKADTSMKEQPDSGDIGDPNLRPEPVDRHWAPDEMRSDPYPCPPELEDERTGARIKLDDPGAAVRRSQIEVDALRAELAESHERHAGEVARLESGLAAMRANAEEAVRLERQAAQGLQRDLRETHGRLAAREIELDELRRTLKRMEEARTRDQRHASAQIESLRAELDAARRDVEVARAEAEHAQTAADRAGAQVDSLRNRVSRAQAVLEDEP